MFLIVTVAIGAIAIAAEILWSHLRDKRLYRLGDTFTNLSAAAVEHLFAILVAVPVYELYAWAFRYRVIEPLPMWAALPLALALMDLGFYWWHRASHRIAILWFGHAVHHSSEEFNFSVAVRSSGWARFTQRFFYLPMAFAGVPVTTMVLADVITTLYALFLHNRFVPKLGWLEKWIVTPSHHRVHHARNPEYLDKNFGAMFNLWDRLFGTYQAETVLPIYGLTHPLRTHNVGWARFHVLAEIGDRMRRTKGFWQKLVAPFRGPDWDPDVAFDPTTPAAAPEPLVSKATRSARIYAFVQHVVLFVAVFAFTFLPASVGFFGRLSLALWLAFSLAIVGAILDGHRWAIRLEAGRWAVLALAGLMLLRSV